MGAQEGLGHACGLVRPAHVLHALGVIASPEPHPDCKDVRGPDEAARMTEALLRAHGDAVRS
ncbi:MAG: hypothetical protein ACKOIB_03500, partial [Verrucomicrobiota bacterium]